MKNAKDLRNAVAGIALAIVAYFVVKKALLHLPTPRWSQQGLLELEVLLFAIVAAGIVLSELIHYGRILLASSGGASQPIGIREVATLFVGLFGSLGLLVALFAMASWLKVPVPS